MKKCKFDNCVIVNLSFMGAQLKGSSWNGADVKDVDFSYANLMQSNWKNAKLRNVIFSGVIGLEPRYLAECRLFQDVTAAEILLDYTYRIRDVLKKFNIVLNQEVDGEQPIKNAFKPDIEQLNLEFTNIKAEIEKEKIILEQLMGIFKQYLESANQTIIEVNHKQPDSQKSVLHNSYRYRPTYIAIDPHGIVTIPLPPKSSIIETGYSVVSLQKSEVLRRLIPDEIEHKDQTDFNKLVNQLRKLQSIYSTATETAMSKCGVEYLKRVLKVRYQVIKALSETQQFQLDNKLELIYKMYHLFCQIHRKYPPKSPEKYLTFFEVIHWTCLAILAKVKHYNSGKLQNQPVIVETVRRTGGIYEPYACAAVLIAVSLLDDEKNTTMDKCLTEEVIKQFNIGRFFNHSFFTSDLIRNFLILENDPQKTGPIKTRGAPVFNFKHKVTPGVLDIYNGIYYLIRVGILDEDHWKKFNKKMIKIIEKYALTLPKGISDSHKKIESDLLQKRDKKSTLAYSGIKTTSTIQRVKSNTPLDGNCFFHAAFGVENSNGIYEACNANEMRKVWHELLVEKFKLGFSNLPKALKEQLEKILVHFLEAPQALADNQKEIDKLVKVTLNEKEKKEKLYENLVQEVISKFRSDGTIRVRLFEVFKKHYIKHGKSITLDVLYDDKLSKMNKNSLKYKMLINAINEVLFECAKIINPNMTKTEKEFSEYYSIEYYVKHHFCGNQVLLGAYLNSITKTNYFVFVEEIPILATLFDTSIELHRNGAKPIKFTPNADMKIESKKVRFMPLSSNNNFVKIFHSGNHFTRKISVPKDYSCGQIPGEFRTISKFLKEKKNGGSHTRMRKYGLVIECDKSFSL